MFELAPLLSILFFHTYEAKDHVAHVVYTLIAVLHFSFLASAVHNFEGTTEQWAWKTAFRKCLTFLYLNRSSDDMCLHTPAKFKGFMTRPTNWTCDALSFLATLQIAASTYSRQESQRKTSGSDQFMSRHITITFSHSAVQSFPVFLHTWRLLPSNFFTIVLVSDSISWNIIGHAIMVLKSLEINTCGILKELPWPLQYPRLYTTAPANQIGLQTVRDSQHPWASRASEDRFTILGNKAHWQLQEPSRLSLSKENSFSIELDMFPEDLMFRLLLRSNLLVFSVGAAAGRWNVGRLPTELLSRYGRIEPLRFVVSGAALLYELLRVSIGFWCL
jgi:hypothetical protein